MKVKFKYRQGQKYKVKTITVDYETVKDDFWKMPGAYDCDKLFAVCRKYIADNGGVLVSFQTIK